MATGARGEAYLELDGETYVILFTNRALADAERATGKSVTQLAGQAEALGIGDVAHLLAVGLEWGRREGRQSNPGYNANDAWRLLDQLGFAVCLEAVLTALAAVLVYRPTKAQDGPPA